MKINQQAAIDFFYQYQPKKQEKIITCDLIHDGYTNISYHLKTSKHDYFIKLSKHIDLATVDETIFYETYLKDLLLYSNQQNYLFKWVETINLIPEDYYNPTLIKKVFNEIDKIHKLSIDNLLVFDWFSYHHIQKKKKIMNFFYEQILNKYYFNVKVVSHGDVNMKNFLYDQKTKKVHLIDFEWARMNYDWFDYINFISESCVSSQATLNLLRKHLNKQYSDPEIYELIFVKWFFSWAWAKANKSLKDIKKYEKLAWKQTKTYFAYLKKISFSNNT